MNEPNIYLERIAARMKADGFQKRLSRHWAARCERALHGAGWCMDRAGLCWLSGRYTDAVHPLLECLSRIQFRYIIKRYF